MHGIWFKSQLMKKEIYIQIPEPCHEDWNKMTPVQQGRYCQSCSKEVVDFTLMTDQEIMNFVSMPRGKTCGNFSSDQLNRVIKEPTTPAKKRVWAVMLSFLLPLLVSNKVKAQLGKPKITIVPESKRLTGMIAFRRDTIATVQPQQFYVHGTVTDSLGNPVEGASVIIKGTHIGVAANDKGQFDILISNRKDAILQISSIGYKTAELKLVRDTSNVQVILHRSEATLNDVVLNPVNMHYRRSTTSGMLAIVRTKTIRNEVVDTIKNLIKPSLLNVYPNPASRSAFVNVEPQSAGSYQLRLLDNDGKVVQQNSFTISAKRQAYQLELPSSIAAGNYYINVIDERSKKQYTQKLIIQ
jgi:hypothetical protein